MEKQNPPLTCGLSAVYDGDDGLSSFLVAGPLYRRLFVFVNIFHARHVRENSISELNKNMWNAEPRNTIARSRRVFAGQGYEAEQVPAQQEANRTAH